VFNATAVRFTNSFSGATIITNIETSIGSCFVAGNTVLRLSTPGGRSGCAYFSIALSSSNGAITAVASATTLDNEVALPNTRHSQSYKSEPRSGPQRALSQWPTLDLAWDATHGRLLATENTNVPNWRDTMMSFDPETLTVETVVPAGAAANRIVVSPTQ
jgi:hypothetical protein